MKSTPRLLMQLFNEQEEVAQEFEQATGPVDQPVDNVDKQTTKETEAFLEIQYNKEAMRLDREKAIELAQKGMNYDKIYEKVNTYEQELNQLKNSGELKFMNDFLKQNGFNSFKEYEEALKIDEILKEKQHLNREEAEEIYRGRLEREARQREQEERQAEQEKQNQAIEQLNRFEAKFGNIDVKDLPDEVINMYSQGIDLSIAYELHQLRSGNDRTKIEQETLQKLQENSNSATGSANKGKPQHVTSWANASKEDFEAKRQEVLRMQR